MQKDPWLLPVFNQERSHVYNLGFCLAVLFLQGRPVLTLYQLRSLAEHPMPLPHVKPDPDVAYYM
jgi:hypothetical protein